MNKKINISILLVSVILNWSCRNHSESKNEIISKSEKDTIIQGSKPNPTKTSLTKYDKKWVRYENLNGITLSEVELYISENGDTISWNRKIYENGVLDLTKSNFYDMDVKRTTDSLIKGRITLNLELDYTVKGPVKERELTVQFVNKYLGKKKAIVFESKNKNYVDFEFKNDNDTLIGLLTDYRRVDILQQPDSTRMIWSKFPVDNKSSTNNLFIHVHELGKNKR